MLRCLNSSDKRYRGDMKRSKNSRPAILSELFRRQEKLLRSRHEKKPRSEDL